MKTQLSLVVCLAITACSLAGCMQSVAVVDKQEARSVIEVEKEARSVSEAEKEPRSVSEGEPQPTPALDQPLLAQATAEPPTKPANQEKPKNTDAAPSTRPKADRTPRKPGEPIRITFDHIIIGMQADIVFRPWMLSDDVKELEGQKVSITGVMHGGSVDKEKNIKWFVLLRNAECKYGPGGQADHLAEVELKTPFSFTSKTVRVEGTLRIVPKSGSDGNTLSLYTLEDAVATEQR
jgi:hypothetical protein